MTDDPNLSGLWLEGYDDALMRGAEMDGAPPRPAQGYVVVPRAWLARVRPVLRSTDRLLVALELYRLCLMRRSRTVKLPNSELKTLGISRRTKHRALLDLEVIGAITVEPRNGRSTRVTLHWFP
jgi:hypothetical protein